MNNVKERLDNLKKVIQEPDFLEGKGLSNEVNIRIFCYDASQELIIKNFTESLVENKTLSCHLIECNLYKTFLEICKDIDILDAIVEMEKSDGKEFLLEQIHAAIGVNEFVEKICYEPHENGDVLMLTGVGEVFPFMRIHNLLEALQPHFSDIPILVMYPGVFNTYQLKLFDKLKPNDYYRAFNEI